MGCDVWTPLRRGYAIVSLPPMQIPKPVPVSGARLSPRPPTRREPYRRSPIGLRLPRLVGDQEQAVASEGGAGLLVA